MLCLFLIKVHQGFHLKLKFMQVLNIIFLIIFSFFIKGKIIPHKLRAKSR